MPKKELFDGVRFSSNDFMDTVEITEPLICVFNIKFNYFCLVYPLAELKCSYNDI